MQLLKLFEHGVELLVRNSRPGVVNFDPKLAGSVSAANQHTAALRVFYCVPDDVVHNCEEHLSVAENNAIAAPNTQFESFLVSPI